MDYPNDEKYNPRGSDYVFSGEIINNYGLCVEEMGGLNTQKLKDYVREKYLYLIK